MQNADTSLRDRNEVHVLTHANSFRTYEFDFDRGTLSVTTIATAERKASTTNDLEGVAFLISEVFKEVN